ncbi:MAG: RNA polymerase sigma factor [Phycisphaerales bacterium]
MDRIAARYWPAIFGYLRKSGRDHDTASDLTQGFICDVVVDGDLLERADPNRGRFRTLLLTSLRNYTIQRHRHAHRLKRRPDGGVASLDAVGTDHGVDVEGDPEAAFNAEWGRTLIRTVLAAASEECEASDLATHWAIFDARVVRPLFQEVEPMPYADLVSKFALDDESQAANMMVTAKRRFARALRMEIGRTVADPTEIDAELNELMSSLGGSRS